MSIYWLFSDLWTLVSTQNSLECDCLGWWAFHILSFLSHPADMYCTTQNTEGFYWDTKLWLTWSSSGMCWMVRIVSVCPRLTRKISRLASYILQNIVEIGPLSFMGRFVLYSEVTMNNRKWILWGYNEMDTKLLEVNKRAMPLSTACVSY